MDYDRLDMLSRALGAGASRRSLLALLTTGAVTAPLGFRSDATAAKKQRRLQRRKRRCLQQQRTFCAGQCCPPGQACEDRACFETCPAPYTCANLNGGNTCADNENCFCGQTVAGAGACVATLVGQSCDDLPPCGSDAECPAGTLCATCSCDEDTGTIDDYRCQALCFSG